MVWTSVRPSSVIIYKFRFSHDTRTQKKKKPTTRDFPVNANIQCTHKVVQITARVYTLVMRVLKKNNKNKNSPV